MKRFLLTYALYTISCACLLSYPLEMLEAEAPYLQDNLCIKGDHRGPRGPRGHRGKKGHRGHKGVTGAAGQTGAVGPAGSTVVAMAQQFAPSVVGVTGPSFSAADSLQLIPIGSTGGSYATSGSDITFDPTTSRFTVHSSGTYLLRYGMVGFPNDDFERNLLVLTTESVVIASRVIAYITPVVTRGSETIPVGGAEFVVGGSTKSGTGFQDHNVMSAFGQCLFVLQAGDVVDLELYLNGTPQSEITPVLLTNNNLFNSTFNMCPGGTLSIEKTN